MDKGTKIWLIIAASLILVGCIIFVGVMTRFRWDFTKLSTVKYETNTYEISETFHSISMKTDTADVIFALSDDGKCKVECYEEENAKHSVTVEEGTLTIQLINERTLSDYIGYIGINFGSPKITVYLPKAEYTSLFISEDTGDIIMPKDFSFEDVNISLSTGDVDFYASASKSMSIKASTGDICVDNIYAGSLNLAVSTGKLTASGVTCQGDVTVTVSTGKTYLTDITCKNFSPTGNTGNISLNNAIIIEKLSIVRSTGDVKFESCDADEIFVETDTGSITGTLLSEKVFVTKTSTGRINVPNSSTGGKCELVTSTGNINISIQ